MLTLHIDDKTFHGKLKHGDGKLKHGVVRIKIKNPEDLLFFANMDKHTKIDIPYTKILGHGVFVGCFTRMDFNEEWVDIEYDYYKIIQDKSL